MKKNITIFVICCTFLKLFIAEAEALVAITNGNYFSGYVDISFPGTNPALVLKFERTYNSRSQFEGSLGYGWGTEFESFLIAAADGSVIVQESGGGERTRYTPEKFDKKILEDYVKNIVKEKAKKQGISFNAKELEDKLMRDADTRDEEGRTLGIAPQLPIGTKLFSSERGDKQSITVIKDGYVREFGDKKKVYFTKKAKVKDFGVDARRRVIDAYKVTKFEDAQNGIILTFKYKNNGLLEEISDGKDQKLRFEMSPEGKILAVKDKRDRGSSYKYCKSTKYSPKDKCGPGDLIESLDAGGNTYKYEYDNVHNLTKIIYSDNTAEEIAYWPPAPPGEGGAKSVKSRKGVLTEYTYWSDPADRRMHFKTDVKTTFRSGRSTTASYEYVRKRRADGSSYKYKMVTDIDGEKTETIYNECCGQPLQITEADGVTKFDYFPNSGLPKMKDTPTETTNWEYSAEFHGKVTKVTIAKKGANAKPVETVFDYNGKGNLAKAKTSDGRGVALAYDTKNRIKTMVDQEKRKISFEYNEQSKPVEIKQDGVGSIIVVYDEKGNIEQVKPKGEKEVALTVTEAFQNLLEIIKPAGIQPI